MFSLLCVNGECVLGKKTGAAGRRYKNAFIWMMWASIKKRPQNHENQTVILNKMQHFSLTHNGPNIGSPRVIYQLHWVGHQAPFRSWPCHHCGIAFSCLVEDGIAPHHIHWVCISCCMRERRRGSLHPLGCDHHCTLCFCSQIIGQN